MSDEELLAEFNERVPEARLDELMTNHREALVELTAESNWQEQLIVVSLHNRQLAAVLLEQSRALGADIHSLSKDIAGIAEQMATKEQVAIIITLLRSIIDGDIPRPPPIPLQLPTPATHFTGRGPEMEALLAALQPGRIVTLYGPGGIGKTALTAEGLWALFPPPAPPGGRGDRPPLLTSPGGRGTGLPPLVGEGWGEGFARFPGGVLFHSFYGRPAAVEAAAEFARSCGVAPNPDPLAALAAALLGRTALLVFDGAEECDDLDALLERRGGCGVLISSRRRADVHDAGIEVDRLPLDDALALLRAVANPLPGPLPEGEGADSRTEGEGAEVEVCELVGSLPLALRLAGANMFQTSKTAAEFRTELKEDGLAALDFGERRAKSVPILMSKSAAQVGEAARAALGVAGCLALQPIDLAPLAAALEIDERAARRALGELVNYELLRRAEARYEATHALVHAYARERLPVETTALRRLGDYYAALAETESAKGLPGYQRLNPERAHVLAVLARLAAAGAWDTANRLVWAVEDWLDVQGYPGDRSTALEVGLVAARAMGRTYDEGSHLMHLGLAHSAIGEVQAAISRNEEALVIFRKTNDKRSQGNALGNLGNAYSDLGQVERAIEQYEAALAIAREIGDRRGEGNRLGNLGNAYYSLGQVERAIEQYEAALAIQRETGDRRGEGNHLGNLGSAYYSLGQVERAIEQYEAALAISREIGDRRGEGAHLGNLGLAYADLGQVERAITQYEAALAIAREIGDRRGEGNRLGNLGNAYYSLGQVERAIEQYEAALAIQRETGDRRGEGNHLGNLGSAYYSLGQVERAIQFYEAALAIAREIGDRRGEGGWLGNLGSAYRNLGQLERAIEQYEAALAIAREIGDRRGEGNHLYNRGLALKQLERKEEAIVSFEAALAAYESIDAPQDAEDARAQLARLRGDS